MCLLEQAKQWGTMHSPHRTASSCDIPALTEALRSAPQSAHTCLHMCDRTHDPYTLHTCATG